MQLERLRPYLPADVDRDLEALFHRFAGGQGGRHGTVDPTMFAAWLAAQGRITPEQLRDILTSMSVAYAPATPGTTTNERFRLLSLLGRGAMGEVHIARDEALNRNVAVKRLSPKLIGEQRSVSRFLTEVQVTAQLDHPGIVPVYAYEVGTDGVPQYAMKLVRGRTLEAWLGEVRTKVSKHSPLAVSERLAGRLEVFLQIAAAVHYAHTRGVLHRDLKPENIMLGPHHEVIVMDWGVARLVEAGEASVEVRRDEVTKTTAGTVIGTATFMSPEQAEGRTDEVDARSDQYALGLILFELVSLKRAITGANATRKLYRASRGEKDKLEPSEGFRIRPELVAIIERATARDRANRYADVEELADDVRRYLRDEPVRALPDGALQRLGRLVSRHRDRVMIGGLALVVVALLGVLATLLGGIALAEGARQNAAIHEEKLARLVATIATQAHTVDTELLRGEASVAELSSAAKVIFHQPAPTGLTAYRSETFGTPDGPPDAKKSEFYREIVSFDFPDHKWAPGTDLAAVSARNQQLAALYPSLRETLLRSAGPDGVGLSPAGERKLLLEQGARLIWTYVAVEEGGLVGLPGVGTYPGGYDPRQQEWYQRTLNTHGAQWGPASLDESGMGLLITCSEAIYSRENRFLGVAAIDMSLSHLVEDLLAPPSLKESTEQWLIDANGRTIVWSKLGRDQQALPPFPHPTVLTALRGEQRSGAEQLDDRLILWAPVPVVGWTYVVTGDASALLSGE
jgi:tRNA A-37 threonylcarbamoyl transferase component Bud32